jgi:hypothetical protein
VIKVNTSVTSIDLDFNQVGAEVATSIDALTARNNRLRHLFLFDARQMLLSVLCADECGVVWPYLLAAADVRYVAQASNCFGNVASLRSEFAIVVEERRRRAAAPTVRSGVDNVDKGDSRAAKRRRTNR